LSEKRTAVLIDAGFLRAKFSRLPNESPANRATRIVDIANATLISNEELFRIYYYDCPPYEGSGANRPHPMLGTTQPVSNGSIHWSKSLLDHLRVKEYVAVRLGEMSFDGWGLKDGAAKDIATTGRAMIAR